MDNPDPAAVEDILGRITATIDYAQSGERIRSLMALNRFIVTELVELLEEDEELGPELQAVAEHLTEAQEALHRCHQFATARFSVRLEAE